MDTEDTSHPVDEGDNSTISIEFFKSELETNTKHDSITGHDIDNTVCVSVVLDIELQTVDHSFIAELATVVTGHWGPGSFPRVPICRLDLLSILIVDLVGTRSVVLDSNNETW